MSKISNHFPSSSKKRPTAFTLIELLVVMAIIALLSALAYPAILSALDNVKKAQAAAIVNKLKIGLAAYKTEYGTWPQSLMAYTNANGDIAITNNQWGAVVCTLSGYTNDPAGFVTNGTTNNSRVIAYVDFQPANLSASTTAPYAKNCTNYAAVQNLIDPWQHPFQMILDGNYDNQVIGVPDITSTNPSAATVSVMADIAVWSTAKTGSTPNQYIASWK